MKSKSSLYKILFISLVALFFSCGKSTELDNLVSKAGLELSDKLSSTYLAIDEHTYIEKYQKDLISILSTNNEDTKLPDFKKRDLSKHISQRLLLFSLYRQIFEDYNLLADNKYSIKTVKVGETISVFCDSLKTFTDDENLKKAADEISKTSSQSKFDKYDVLRQLGEVMLEIVEKDLRATTMYMNEAFISFDAGLNQIPMKVFDVEKIAKEINEPYNDKNVIINLYKLKLRDKAYAEKKALDNQIRNVNTAMQVFVTANAEMSKKRPVEKDVVASIDKVHELLKNLK